MKQFFTLVALFMATSLALMAQDLQEGLVIHYPFEGNLTDTISGITAENNGNLTFDQGQVGTQAVRFFNQDAYFVTPEGKLQVGPTADGGTPGTFALFVNHRPGPLETERHNYIAQKNGCGPEDNNRGRVVLYRQGPNASPGSDSITSFISGRRLLSDYKLDTGDVWIHLALTIEPDKREWAIFADGVEVGRDTFPGTAQAENSCGEFVIGHHLTFTTETQTFDGLMDDLRFYNRVLSAEEIQTLANQFSTSTREEVLTDAIRLSPNPVAANQEVSIALDRSIFLGSAPVRLNVVDASGRTVLQRRYDTPANRLTLAHDLPSGLYTLTLTNGRQLATARMIVR